MQKMEMRKQSITYCDYCECEIDDYTYATKKYKKSGKELDFHSIHTFKIKESCLEKFEKEKLQKGGMK